MKEFTRVMKALSDPNRVKIVKMLQHKELCVCEMQVLLGIAQPTVSKHLKILEEAGLLVTKKEGLWVNCRLSDGGRSPYAATMLGNMKHWLECAHEIRTMLDRLDSVNREKICGR